MDKFLVFSALIVCFCKYETNSLNLPGPRVYVVTPAPQPPSSISAEGRAAPFYYHNWMRRMDPPRNATTTTTPKPVNPDLIFAEFESGNKMKSIRNLLEREKIQSIKTSTTTWGPIYISDDTNDEPQGVTDISSTPTTEKKEDTKPVDMTDYFALYNNLYNPDSAAHAPVYMSSTPSSSTTTTTSTTTPSSSNMENIWQIIDSQKVDQYSGQWEEQPVTSEDGKDTSRQPKPPTEDDHKTEDQSHDTENNFASPEFATNPGNGADNESRAIRTEPNMRFPYVNLKPYQIKSQTNPHTNIISNSKKGNNMFTSLDKFHDDKNPVRGEAQDVVVTMRHPIDRYNPAQPYLPDYGSKSKQSSSPSKDVANLVPPPPPPPPRVSDGNFPAPASYEPFPPYAPSASPPASPSPPLYAPKPPLAPRPVILYQPPVVETSDNLESEDPSSDSYNPPMDLEYDKPPSPPIQPFAPTLPPLMKPSDGYFYNKPPMSKPFSGYSYDKPPMSDDSPPDNDDTPDFHGYHFSNPEPYHHDFDDHDFHHYHHHHTTTTTTTEMPRVNRYSYYYLGKKLYYLPLYFSVYFIVYVGALIIKAVLRHKIVYPNSWRPNDQTASFFSKRSVDSFDLSNENLHEITGRVTHAIAVAGQKYFSHKKQT